MIKTNLRSAVLVAGLALGLAACSNTPTPNDGGVDGGDGGTTTGSTTGGTTSGTSTGSTTTSTSSTSGSTTGTGSGTTGTGTTGTGTSTGTTTSQGTANTGGTPIQLRLANFAPGMAAPVDICYINNDDVAAGWQGPLFALGSGSSRGVPYPGISAYTSPSGAVDITDVRVIPAPITNVVTACIDAGTIGTVAFVAPPNGSGHLIIGGGRSGTLAVEGFGPSGNFKVSVYGYNDEISTNIEKSAVLRFINASPVAGTFDFGTDANTLLVTGAAFGAYGTATNADPGGYVPFVADGGVFPFDVVQLSQIQVALTTSGMSVGNGYSFYYGSDQNAANTWAFFCDDSFSGLGNNTFCHWPDGGTLLLTDGGF